MKAILKPDAVNAYIELHKKMHLPFKIYMSNYTTRIKSAAYDIHFMKSAQPNRVFAAFNMVKSDVTKKPKPRVQINKCEYFSEAFLPHDFYSEIIFNFDIKSAYATVLFNEGFISKKTFEFINKLPKQERLAAVGMLAGKKEIYDVDSEGEIQSVETVISETAEYFFYCVKRTYEIIQGAAFYLGEAFLFSWVDGIYFLQNPDSVDATAKIMLELYFKEKNFNVTFEKLTEFNVIVKKHYYHCNYRKKDKEGNDEVKTMNVPKKENIAIKKITDYLLTKKYNNEKFD